MRKPAGSTIILLLAVITVTFTRPARAADVLQEKDLYAGWLKMYDLKFDDAHRSFAAWKQNYPNDPLGPASNAAAYLFSELARLGAFESELFVDDSRFKERAKLRPDSTKKLLFGQEIARAEQLADAAPQRSGNDPNALS
jgi:hypothetical protein